MSSDSSSSTASSRANKIERPAILGAAHTDISEYDSNTTTNLDLIQRRQKHLGGSILFYHDPVHLVRGEGVWLYDDKGRQYLDCYNNVPVVGHCHPRVVKALTDQASVLNTHTRYLHENVVNYAEQLAAAMPGDLEVCMFVCSGTEANELAMRIARAVTGHNGAIVMEGAYHGNSTLIGELSTMGSSVDQRPDHVIAVEPPNTYRGPFRRDKGRRGTGRRNNEAEGQRENLGEKYAALVGEAIATLDARGQKTAAFMCDGIFDSHGVIEAPKDYFQQVYKKVRAAGGLCIADEVQPGFARTGKMWGFENYDVIPDIVTLGKPMGNGHPIAGVVTTREISEKFQQSAFYFNTFGGNPVSTAVGKAVLDVIADENIIDSVMEVGTYLRQQLECLAQRHTLIGNVRGQGLFQAIELVRDHATLEPATEEARQLPDALKEEGVLVGLTGRYGNVLKIRPPLVFSKENVDQLIAALEKVLP